MHLRVDTAMVHGGGRQIQLLTDHLVSTMSAAESTLRSAAENVGQPAVRTALDELLETLRSTHQRVTTGIDVFAREVQIAAEVYEQQDAELADAVPDPP